MKRSGIQRGTSQLKRTPMPQRKTPMDGGRISIEPGKSWANPAKPLKAKPTPMSPEEKAGRKGVRLRSVAEREIDGDLVSGEWCECCTDDVFGSEWSHRIGRAQCGTWALSNGLWACEFCHRWMHANPNAAKEHGWHVHPAGDTLTAAVLYRGEWSLLDDDGGVSPSLPFEEAS